MDITINEDGLTIINGKFGPIVPKVTVYAKRCCGCCTVRLRFHSLEKAQEAFKRAGLTVDATIRDDAGIVHEEVDTFYGFSENEEEQGERSLGYLIDQLP